MHDPFDPDALGDREPDMTIEELREELRSLEAHYSELFGALVQRVQALEGRPYV